MSGSGTVEKHRARWTARYRFTDSVTGKRREIRRTAKTKVEASALLDEIRRAHGGSGGTTRAFDRLTFSDLCDYYLERYAQPASYVDGRKVSGLRSFQTVRGHLARLRDFFGRRQLRSISHGDLMDFRRDLLRSPTRRGDQRSLAHVNRVMATLRRMMGIALRQRWILESPFQGGDSLISVADERSRERVLSLDEERRLLAACDHPRRRHLRTLLIVALDTGCRRGELLTLRWKDVDFGGQRIVVQAMHTKTLQTRAVPMTARVASELSRLREATPAELVFGVVSTVKRSFSSATKEADIVGLRFHDLRHTAATRLAQGHLPLAEVGRILGHSVPATTYRYLNADSDTLRRAVEILEAVQAGERSPGMAEESVN